MTAAVTAAVTALLESLAQASVIELEHDRFIGAPIFPAHWPGFIYTLHRHHERTPAGARTSASGTITMQEHSGTHIDALCHQAVNMEMFGGVPVDATTQTDRGFTELGAETIPPIFRRGILLDVPAALGTPRLDPGYLISDHDLERAARVAAVEIRPGDCLLVRTGTGQLFDQPETYLEGAGIGQSGARWLAARDPFLCGADNVAFDYPSNNDPDLGLLPSHTVLIVERGIYIVENLNLEPLSHRGINEFVFVCLPMKLRGVTGSPVRPVALAYQADE